MPVEIDDNQLAFLLTNAEGQIVYADSVLREVMKRGGEGVVGAPMHEVLGIDQQMASEFIMEVRDVGTVEKRQMDLRDMTGGVVHVTATGWASYRDQEGFVGINLKFRQTTRQEEQDVGLEQIDGDVVGFQIEQRLNQAGVLDDDAYLRLYTVTHIDALQVFLARALGLGVRDKLEAAINKAAKKNKWPVSMVDGEVKYGEGLLDIKAYRTLLGEAVKYAEYLLGSQIVAAEMESIDAKMNEKMPDVAGQSGLRDLFQ